MHYLASGCQVAPLEPLSTTITKRGGNSSNEDRGNKLIEKIHRSLDDQQDEKAESQLGNYYHQFENNEKDY